MLGTVEMLEATPSRGRGVCRGRWARLHHPGFGYRMIFGWARMLSTSRPVVERCSQRLSHPGVSGTPKNTSMPPRSQQRNALAPFGDSRMLLGTHFPLPFVAFPPHGFGSKTISREQPGGQRDGSWSKGSGTDPSPSPGAGPRAEAGLRGPGAGEPELLVKGWLHSHIFIKKKIKNKIIIFFFQPSGRPSAFLSRTELQSHRDALGQKDHRPPKKTVKPNHGGDAGGTPKMGRDVGSPPHPLLANQSRKHLGAAKGTPRQGHAPCHKVQRGWGGIREPQRGRGGCGGHTDTPSCLLPPSPAREKQAEGR